MSTIRSPRAAGALPAVLSALLPAALTAGCVEAPDGDAPDDATPPAIEATATAEQAFTGTWSYSWGDTKYSRADLGTAVNRACFMSGVAGYLTVNKFPEGHSQAGAGVGIDAATNRWYIYVQPAFTATLQTWARCVSTTTLTPEVTWRAGQPKKLLAAATPNRRCFFTNLRTGRDNEFDHGGFQSAYDQVFISSDGANYYIDGDQSGLIWASARCFDVTEDQGQFFNFALPGNTITVAMRPEANGNTCGLTQVAGRLTASNDWENGLIVKYNSMYDYFDLQAKNNTGGRARCVR
jgi:hypothetical protein